MTLEQEKKAVAAYYASVAYIQYDEDAGAGIELFDMENDPKQFTNLAGDFNEARNSMDNITN